MTHKAQSPDGLDASKLNKSDGGASVQKQRNGWYDSVAAVVLRIPKDKASWISLNSFCEPWLLG